MSTEVIYQDGSMSEFHDDGGSSHHGDLALDRIRLITAKLALEIYFKYDGRMELTRNGSVDAVRYVIEPLTGKKYKRSMQGKQEAFNDCIELLAYLESNTVHYTQED